MHRRFACLSRPLRHRCQRRDTGAKGDKGAKRICNQRNGASFAAAGYTVKLVDLITFSALHVNPLANIATRQVDILQVEYCRSSLGIFIPRVASRPDFSKTFRLEQDRDNEFSSEVFDLTCRITNITQSTSYVKEIAGNSAAQKDLQQLKTRVPEVAAEVASTFEYKHTKMVYEIKFRNFDVREMSPVVRLNFDPAIAVLTATCTQGEVSYDVATNHIEWEIGVCRERFDGEERDCVPVCASCLRAKCAPAVCLTAYRL